jgi:hypothetical protein
VAVQPFVRHAPATCAVFTVLPPLPGRREEATDLEAR